MTFSFQQKNHYWTDWKALQKKISSTYRFDQVDDVYIVWFYDGPDIHICKIWQNIVPNDIIESGYTQEQNDLDKSDFENKYKSNTPVYQQKTSDGRLRIANEKSDLSKKTFFTPDWTDPTTWYQNSVKTTENATNSGDNKTYNLSHVNIIDLYHGKVTQEDFIKDSNEDSYRVSVTVNGDTKIEQDPHYGSGSDFTVNYESGSVTFINELTETDVVNVTYHYSSGSTFVIKPDDGTSLQVTFAEAQFSDDVIMTDSVVFQPYGFVDVFAPQLMPGIPSGTKIPLGNPVIYKSFTDFQNEAVKAYPTYPVMGGNNWRAAPRAIYVFDWDYVASTVLRADYGMEVRISLQHNTPFQGWYATATLYCTSQKL